MIDITIKTLDSRNHVFSVEDELTVKQLKERIAESVNVPVESQRLIYCGRVLVDEKKLSEYDVHGKVIHLVQRAPPSSSSQDNSGSGAEPRATPAARRGPFRTIITPGRMDGASGNAMYLGAMAFPADLMDAQGISMPQPRHRLSQSRLTVARAMLRRARYTLLNLENPLHSELPHENSSTHEDIQQDIAAHAAAIVAEITGATSNVGVQHTPPHINVEASASGGDGEMHTDEAEPSPEQNSPDESPSGEEAGTQNAGGESSESTRNGRYRFPGPVHMAEIISLLRDIERRLSPFLERFHELVRTDPILDNPNEAQRLFDLVSKMMHYLAHAYHAISDIMCDFSQPPPRRLRCRPVLIQHSAVLQTGIPIQASLNVSGNSNVSMSSSSSSSSNNNNATLGAGSAEGLAVDRTETEPSEEPRSLNPPPPPQQQGSAPESGRPGNLSGGNFEFYMDVGQGSITIDSVEATLVTNSGQGGTENTGTSITSGPFPWGSPPPEFIQNLMQALAGQMMAGGGGGGGGGGGATSSSGQPSGPANAEANVTNSQARGNTSTQPTTSTQTRSTTRPHVHIAPGFPGREHRAFGPGYFDPFLPCNSHHIHSSRRRGEPPETVINNNNSSTSNQSTSQSTGTSTSSFLNPPRRPTSETPPPFINFFTNLISGLRNSTSQGQGPPFIRILPRDVTVFLQSSPSFQNSNITRETSVADLLQGLPDHSYTEGNSLFSDLIMTLARNLRVMDVLNLGNPNSNVLMGLRPALVTFIRTRLLNGRDDKVAISEAISKINAEMRPLIESIISQEDIPLREDVDIVATICQLNDTMLPIIFRDILVDADADFVRNMLKHCNEYARHLASILFHCCHNGQEGLEAIYSIIARRFIVGVPPPLQNWSVVNIVNQLRTMSSVLETSREVQPFLVYRMADAPAGETASSPQAMDTESASEANPSPSTGESELRVVYSPPAVSPSKRSPDLSLAEVSPQRVISPREVVSISPTDLERDIGWQSAVPPDWVPIISRDRERQRRQAVQGALSDAYLAGMPSKRRKIIASSKPHTNLARVITESMSSALGAAGVDEAEPGLAETAGGDSSLRAAYKEQVKNTLSPTLRQHPDFTPEKYPAAAKLFTSK